MNLHLTSKDKHLRQFHILTTRNFLCLEQNFSLFFLFKTQKKYKTYSSVSCFVSPDNITKITINKHLQIYVAYLTVKWYFSRNLIIYLTNPLIMDVYTF